MICLSTLQRPLTVGVQGLISPFRIFALTAMLSLTMTAYLAGTSPSTAQVTHKTKIKHYKIRGTTPLGLVRAMHRKGVKTESGVILASLHPKISSALNVPSKSCRGGKTKIDVNFTIKLPKPRNHRKLSDGTAKSFNLFYDFLKKHEEEHRRIVVQCLARFHRKAQVVLRRTRSCKGFDKVTQKIERIGRTEIQRCEARHNALDRRDEAKISRTRLYKAAFAEVKGKSRASVPVPRIGFNSQSLRLNDGR